MLPGLKFFMACVPPVSIQTSDHNDRASSRDMTEPQAFCSAASAWSLLIGVLLAGTTTAMGYSPRNHWTVTPTSDAVFTIRVFAPPGIGTARPPAQTCALYTASVCAPSVMNVIVTGVGTLGSSLLATCTVTARAKSLMA